MGTIFVVSGDVEVKREKRDMEFLSVEEKEDSNWSISHSRLVKEGKEGDVVCSFFPSILFAILSKRRFINDFYSTTHLFEATTMNGRCQINFCKKQ